MIQVFLDGDWILYAAGFAGQKTEMIVPALSNKTYKNITEVSHEDGYQAGMPVYSRTLLDPPEFFFHSAKRMIESQMEKITQKYDEDDAHLTVFVDGNGNFRSRLATIKPYKGTRSSASKPLMFGDIRQYLLDVWKAEVVFDQETDDALAIRQTECNAKGIKSVIVAVDKDMLQVPGIHLNPNKGFTHVTPEVGLARQYLQCVMGDPVDNIGGVYRIGEAKAKKIITPSMSEAQMWEATLKAYADSIDAHGDHYAGLSAEDAAIENMRLVYLLRSRGEELWLPPTSRT